MGHPEGNEITGENSNLLHTLYHLARALPLKKRSLIWSQFTGSAQNTNERLFTVSAFCIFTCN
jgi:hypothetical protein